MDYRAETEFGALCRDLLADLERLRPGLPPGASAAEVQAAAAQRVAVRLGELYAERHEGEDLATSEHRGQLALYRREVEQILLPRYAALAQRQQQAERERAGGFNRLAWATIFFLTGIFAVWAPFIPIWEKWVPFLLGGLAVGLAPALPDLHRALARRRHQVQLLALLIDLDQAGHALPSAPPAHALPAATSENRGPL